MKKTDKSVSNVVTSGLCTGCGTCVGVCPNYAVHMRKNKGVYVPTLNYEKCTNCGVCSKVCPGQSIDLEQLSRKQHDDNQRQSLMGDYTNCFIGHSNDPTIRYNSSSGGLVTAILVFALKQGIINGALVTRMSAKNSLEPEVFIARTPQEIVSASKSKYCPVPANIALREILNTEGKFAVVGLPCHIEGIRKAEEINPTLAKKIVLHLGLICNHTPTFYATDYLLKKMKVKKEDVLNLEYRGRGWPGQLTITLKNGREIGVPQFDPFYWGHVFNSYFSPYRCILCNDKMCELSDISFGDAWTLSNTDKGESLLISRNTASDALLSRMINSDLVELKIIDSFYVIQSQGLDMIKRRHNACVTVFKNSGKETPSFNRTELQPSLSEYIKAVIIYSRFYVTFHPQLWGLIDIYPSFRSLPKKVFGKQ